MYVINCKAFNAVFTLSSLSFYDSYYSNSTLPHCPALLCFFHCYCYGQINDDYDDDDIRQNGENRPKGLNKNSNKLTAV